MKFSRVLIVILLLIAAAGGAWWASRSAAHRHQLVRQQDASGAVYYTCPMHPQVHRDGPGNCPICGMTLMRREERPKTSAAAAKTPLYWYDPMKPEVHFDQPGKSPFMDMALVPKYAEGDGQPEGDAMRVRIDPRMAQNLGMRTARVERGTPGPGLAVVGEVTADEHRIVVVESRAAGWVEKLDVRAVGEAVQRGQSLAAVYAPELLAAQQELSLAQTLGDPALSESARTRLSLLGVDRPGAAGAQRRVTIRAPQAGVVTELLVREGAQVSPGMPLMKLADLSSVWIAAEIPEAQAGRVVVGQPAEASLRALPGAVFKGRVDYVYPTLDAQTRTLRARLVFDNQDGRLRPGMYAEVRLLGVTAESVLRVPSEAVIRTGRRNVVIVAEDLGRYRPVEVTLGSEQDDHISVLSGLSEGQQVVVSGQFLIDSEASLLGAYNRLSPDEPPAAQMRLMGAEGGPSPYRDQSHGTDVEPGASR